MEADYAFADPVPMILSSQTAPARVLLVEDDPLVGSLVRPALEREGLVCERAGTLAQARAAFDREEPHLILLDIHLPDGNGFDFCSELRGRPKQTAVPVIFLTRRGDEESRLRGFAVGGQDYITKPFSIQELQARVRVHLAFANPSDPSPPKGDPTAAEDRLRQDIADMIVHDLRSPLTTVKATLDLLKEAGVLQGHELERILGSAQGAVSHVLLMVGDLLDINAPELRPQLGPLDAAAVVRAVADLVNPQALHRGQALRLRVPLEPLGLQSDERLVFRLLTNLTTNAVKFSSRGTQVELSAERRGRVVRFEVLDRGPGIPAAELEGIFELRVRVRSEAGRDIGGHGIGLAFCRKAALALKGRVWAEQRDGGGCRFVLELPDLDALAHDHLDAEEARLRADFLADVRWRTESAIALLESSTGALDARRVEQLATLGHQVAGTAGTFGLDGAGEAAGALERVCCDPASGPALTKRALEALRLLQRSLRETGPGAS